MALMRAMQSSLSGSVLQGQSTTWKRLALLALPFLLLASTWGVYTGVAAWLGPKSGYFVGFLFYWLFWCLGSSLFFLGPRQTIDLFISSRQDSGRPDLAGKLLLGVPLLLGYGYAFPRALPSASAPILLLSAGIALINGTMEELLWRGIYPRVFPDNAALGYLYPQIGFAIWHYAPQTIFPNSSPGGAHSLVLVAGLLGLMWGWVAWRTKSIRGTTLSHVLFDFSGLGGRIYF